jgi:hypothetical protein
VNALHHGRAAVLALALACLGGRPLDALACSCAPTEDGFLVPARVTLPRNALGIPWSGWIGPEEQSASAAHLARFTVERRGVGSWQSLEPEFVPLPDSMLGRARGPRTGLVRPRKGFEPGWLYRIRSSHPWTGVRAPARPLPEVLVQVTPDSFVAAGRTARVLVGARPLGPVQCATRMGMCATRFLGASSRIELELPEDLRRWAGALLYVVRLEDGTIWRPDSSLCDPTPAGFNSLGRGKELLFSYCGAWPPDRAARPGELGFQPGPTSNLAQGTHAVQFVAWLPGTRETIAGNARVTLSCPAGRRKS